MTIIVAQTKKCPELFQVLGLRHVYDCLHFLLPRLDASWSQVMAEEIRFLYGPLAFLWVARVTVLVELCEDLVE